MANLQTAVSALYARIRRGEEFPDACASVALKYGVDHDELREAYDDECADALEELRLNGRDDTPCIESCDFWGTGEGRYHGVI